MTAAKETLTATFADGTAYETKTSVPYKFVARMNMHHYDVAIGTSFFDSRTEAGAVKSAEGWLAKVRVGDPTCCGIISTAALAKA